MGSALCSGIEFDILAKMSDLEVVLKQQLMIIATSLDDFVQLNACVRVIPYHYPKKERYVIIFQ